MIKAIIALKNETTAVHISQNLASEHFEDLLAAIEDKTPVANNATTEIKVDIITPILQYTP